MTATRPQVRRARAPRIRTDCVEVRRARPVAIARLCLAMAAAPGCGRGSGPSGVEPSASAPPPTEASGLVGAAAPVEAPAAPGGCGTVPCRTFASPVEAFDAAIAGSPLVLAVGEAHALGGTEGIEPSTRRFARDLLPRLRGRASDVVIEILLPNPACQKHVKEARKQQEVITKQQAATDQNDFVALGNAARALGIRPHALEPTCEDLARIGGAGPEAVAVSLDVVTRLSREALERLVDAALASSEPRMIVAYGGAMHNDVAPVGARAAWSFGPALVARTGGRYVELDLIVPEYVKDTPTWRALPWVPQLDFAAHARVSTLLETASAARVLVFPRTEVEPPPAR